MSALPATRPRVTSIDVRELLSRIGGHGDPHLVTRPTGKAVRALIEAELRKMGPGTLCVIDLCGVVVLDFSCADEVAAQVRATASGILLVFRCAGEAHLDQLSTVLAHQKLTAVAEVGPGRFCLLGQVDEPTDGAWSELERVGAVRAGRPPQPPSSSLEHLLAVLADAGLAFQCRRSGSYHALSRFLSL